MLGIEQPIPCGVAEHGGNDKEEVLFGLQPGVSEKTRELDFPFPCVRQGALIDGAHERVLRGLDMQQWVAAGYVPNPYLERGEELEQGG